MEQIHQYRHFISKEVKEIFLDSFKKAIKKIDKKKFGFIGIVGSIEEEKSHDIDILIFPSKKSKIGEAMIELMKLYDETGKELKKHHERYYLSVSPRLDQQEITYYLSSLEEGGAGLIPIHSLFFTNYRDIKKLPPKDFLKSVKTKSLVLHGSWEKIKKLPVLPQKKLEPYFFILNFEMKARIKTFPRHLIRSSAESLNNYLRRRYKLNVKDKIPHNIKKLEKEFIKLMHELDKKTYG